jgi:hypothetical protein
MKSVVQESSQDTGSSRLLFGNEQALIRRGHGPSTQTWDGNDVDTYADDPGHLAVKSL